MTAHDPVPAMTCRLAPVPQSVRDARAFIETALEGVDEDTLYTAKLLTSELVTNAVLHAGTELELSASASGGNVRVHVADGVRSRLPVTREQAPEAGTGRGLHLVTELATAFGVETGDAGKSVWFELGPGSGEERDSRSRWPEAGSAGSTGDAREALFRVVLLDLPVGLCLAGQRHRAALIREAHLALLAGEDDIGVDRAALAEAAATNDILDGALNPVLSGAAEDRNRYEIRVPVRCGPLVGQLVDVLEVLNSAAREGLLLTRPSLPEVRRVRGWLMGEIAGQIAGAPPKPWVALHEPNGPPASVRAAGLDPTDVGSRTVAAVAADDDNTIIAANDALGSLLGWKPGDLTGQRVTVLIPAGWRERHVAGFTNFLLTGETAVIGSAIRVPALHRDGHNIDVDLLITVETTRGGRAVFVAELRPA